ncbi:hypothetical protein BJX61DRAFT_426219 [Aspergillus egyptiacus]|nr:hypothetical protein BJX61DRAFT_426219 [Aspergillus egyptiacus]
MPITIPTSSRYSPKLPSYPSPRHRKPRFQQMIYISDPPPPQTNPPLFRSFRILSQ